MVLRGQKDRPVKIDEVSSQRSWKAVVQKISNTQFAPKVAFAISKLTETSELGKDML